VEWGESIIMNDVKISLHPAGHIIGSSQVRVEHKGEVWVVSGDYKTENDGISGISSPLRAIHSLQNPLLAYPFIIGNHNMNYLKTFSNGSRQTNLQVKQVYSSLTVLVKRKGYYRQLRKLLIIFLCMAPYGMFIKHYYKQVWYYPK
jgi:hypothetical protein